MTVGPMSGIVPFQTVREGLESMTGGRVGGHAALELGKALLHVAVTQELPGLTQTDYAALLVAVTARLLNQPEPVTVELTRTYDLGKPGDPGVEKDTRNAAHAKNDSDYNLKSATLHVAILNAFLTAPDHGDVLYGEAKVERIEREQPSEGDLVGQAYRVRVEATGVPDLVAQLRRLDVLVRTILWYPDIQAGRKAHDCKINNAAGFTPYPPNSVGAWQNKLRELGWFGSRAVPKPAAKK